MKNFLIGNDTSLESVYRTHSVVFMEAEMEGYVDRETNLPVVKLNINQREIPCLVDTGFNGFLWTGIDVAQRVFGMRVNRVDGESELADGSGADYQLEPVEVLWFGRPLHLRMHVAFSLRAGKFPILLGTRLLVGHVLIADFNHGIVQIRDPSVSRVSP